ncbi:MAG: hypothetical protein ACTTKN_03625 [Phocaeicola sp.]|uniref:hypothetical protein n=1 Tax=Phocaeicola TaxID=909656 RepID=UPI00234EA893|nr:hypothetical protein [Phocaeicola oris]MCE2615752.1 hypothetical protein [Phocaeicola oris]
MKKEKKRKWEYPMLQTQLFIPQEYVAVCTTQWKAQCNQRGLIFFDVNNNGVLDPAENHSYDKYEHGQCYKWHTFESVERPGYNAFIVRHAYNSTTYLDKHKSYYSIKPQYMHDPYMIQALVREPGEVFSHNWLVTCDLDKLKNVS